MPEIQLPPNWLDFLKLFSNPFTFGVIISIILGTLGFMQKDSTWTRKGVTVPVPSWLKMLVVILSCFVWAVVVTVLQPGFTFNGTTTVYAVLLLTFTVVFSSQIWHKVVSPIVDQIIQILFGVGATLKARAEGLRPHG